VGFDWPDINGVNQKIHEELDELDAAVGTRDASRMEDELGDVLFAVVNLGRHLDIDPEKALTGSNYKFEQRFRAMEADMAAAGLEIRKLTLEELEQHWRKAKQRVG
jgi:ATP diphosphatase